jgi:drug/metabolite transporter (DMT)-like permease
MPMSELLPVRTVDRMMVLAAALLFSTGGAVVKMTSLTAWQVACLRSGIAAITLVILLPSVWRGWSPRSMLVSCAYAATMISFVLANKLTTAANAVFLQSTAPLYILLAGPFLLREPIRRRHLLFMVALATGMSMILVGGQAEFDTAPEPLKGNVVGFTTGVFWAFTIIGLRWLGKDQSGESTAPSAAAAVVGGNLIACLVTLPAALPMIDITGGDWVSVSYLGIFQIAVAYVFLVRGVRRVSALEVSLLVLLEPVLSPMWAWLVHGERPSNLALLGGALIVAATAFYTWRGSNSELGMRN